MKKKRSLTLTILVATVLGAAVGYGLHETVADKQISADIAAHIAIVTDAFLRLIKMIISLLVFSTLTVGIAHMGDGRAGAAGGPGRGVRARRHRAGIAQGGGQRRGRRRGAGRAEADVVLQDAEVWPGAGRLSVTVAERKRMQRQRAANVTLTFNPRPFSARSSAIAAPCTVAMSRTMARPSPVPPGLLSKVAPAR